MTHLRSTILLALMLPCLALAQSTSSPAAGGNNSDQAIRTIEKALMAAILKGDAAAAEQYLASDAVMVAPDGSVNTKSGFLSDLKSGDLKLTSSVDSDMKLVASSADMAVVMYSTVDKGTYKGEDIGGTYRWLDVFAKRDGKWLLVASQGTEVPKK